MANFDIRNRAPAVERLPDLRQRVTVIGDVLNWVPKTPADILAELWEPWGTIHPQYTTCRLVQQSVQGQTDAFPDTSKRPPTLVRVYEEIPETTEVQVGNPAVEFDQYDNKIVTIESIQFSAGTSTYGVVGYTTAPAPHATAVLKEESRTDDGTLERIKRVYTTRGQLDQVDTLKFGGKVLVRRLKYLNEIPPTPTGFTLVEQSKYFVNGLPVYEYGFASAAAAAGAGGVIDNSTSYSQSSNQGTTGVTVKTISQASDYSVTSNPITTPSEFVLVSEKFTDDSGYRLWTAVYAKGVGEVSRDVDWSQGASASSETVGVTKTTVKYLLAHGGTDPTDVSESVKIGSSIIAQDGYDVSTTTWAKGIGQISTSLETKNNGKLYIQTIKALNTIPLVPFGYTTISTDMQESDGYKIYTYSFAKGLGVISQDIEWSQGAAAGSETVGVTKTTIKYLMSLGGIDPNVVYGSIKIGNSIVEQDGYEISTSVWAKGLGAILYSEDTKNNGALLVRTYKILTAKDGTNPMGTPIGFGLISETYSEADGYRVWTNVFAKGLGEVSRDVDWSQGASYGSETIGVTKTTVKYMMANGGTDPTSVALSTKIGSSISEQDGYELSTTVWAKGIGLVVDNVETKNNGKLKIYSRTALGAVPDTPSATISGTVTLTSDNVRKSDGFSIYDRTWAEGVGQISQDDETKNNGALLICTIRYLAAPGSTNPISTPSFYTPISLTYIDQDGTRLWTQTFANGSGEISRDIDYSQSSDQGTTGITRTTIKYLTAPAGTVLPTSLEESVEIGRSVSESDGHRIWTTVWAKGTGEISRSEDYQKSLDEGAIGITKISIQYLAAGTSITRLPADLSGFVNIGESRTEKDGYIIWDTSWAKGEGLISDSKESRNNGKLYLYKRVSLGAPPDEPPYTIGAGTAMFQVSTDVSNSDGFEIYDYTWAEGVGEIGRATDTKNNGALLLMTVRYLTAATAAEPTPADISGYTKVSVNSQSENGYLAWTLSYAKGVGEISREVDWSQGAYFEHETIGVTRTTVKVLMANGGTDSTTVVGSVKIGTSISEQDGYEISTTTWAKGVGVVVNDISYQYGDSASPSLVKYKKVSLGSAPAAPASTIGGTVCLISTTVRKESGYDVYDYTWAEGKGVITKSVSPRDGGLRIETWVSLDSLTAGTASYMPSGIPITMDRETGDGFTKFTVSCMQSISGGDPTAGFSLEYEDYHQFTYPGRAKAFLTTTPLYVAGTGFIYDVFKSPPVEDLVLSDFTITYQSSSAIGVLAIPLWNPDGWATLVAKWQGMNGYAQAETQSLFGYRAEGSPLSWTAPPYPSSVVILGNNTMQNSAGSLSVTGGPSAPDGEAFTLAVKLEPVFISYFGTQYYRKTVISTTIPAQTSLPV